MDIKHIRTVVMVILFMTTVFATCRKNCADNSYSFTIHAKAYPDKDSIHIGDTLWLEVNSPTTLVDSISGKTVDYSGAQNLGTVVTLLDLLPNNIDSGAINNFAINTIAGSEYNKTTDPLTNKVMILNEGAESYELKMAFIAKRTGNYVLTISNASGVYTRYNKCSKASFEINLDSTNQHFYYLNLWRPDLTLDEAGKLKVYYFKVY